eukprot:TRINITY_DN36792_c0_g1_i1.p1 TRINITY_DN36792_c0_g1~~TRINITY_DN36792_c0_g1_i1.p1  ORF type:complete len:259 (+),score=55.04 TRINITY_DN36792_c0_g1_i1:100-777(+)
MPCPRIAGTAGNALTMFVGLANTGVGAFCVFAFTVQDFDFAKLFLSAYLAIFGILMAISPLKSTRRLLSVPSRPGADPLLGFLGKAWQRAVFIVFLGTLGLGFGLDSHVRNILPFVCGICTCAVAIVVSCQACCFDDVDDDLYSPLLDDGGTGAASPGHVQGGRGRQPESASVIHPGVAAAGQVAASLNPEQRKAVAKAAWDHREQVGAAASKYNADPFAPAVAT